MTVKRDTLFILRAPFEDPELEGTWFCRDCATMEGALLANPQWARAIDIHRVSYPRPRHEVIAALGEEHQSLPALVLADLTRAPADALMAGGTPFITEPKAICRYLAATYGGAGPHP
jgi:hypothetical protein